MARKVTVPEKFFVEQHMDKMKPADIAIALGWKPIQVKRYIEYIKKQAPPPAPAPTNVVEAEAPVLTEPAPPPIMSAEERNLQTARAMAGKTFARHKERPVTAMTESESEIADELRKAASGSTGILGLKNCIRRPFGDSQKTY